MVLANFFLQKIYGLWLSFGIFLSKFLSSTWSSEVHCFYFIRSFPYHSNIQVIFIWCHCQGQWHVSLTYSVELHTCAIQRSFQIYFSIGGRTLRFCSIAGSIFSLHLIICIDSHNRVFVFSMNLENKIKPFTIISSRFII